MSYQHDLPRLPPGPGSRPPPEAIEFQTDATAIEQRPAPLWARCTVALVAAALAVGLAWAGWARMDEVVAAPGRLVSGVPKLVVGPVEISTVRAIAVRPGDTVRRDQVLAELDPTFAAADQAQIANRLGSLEAEIARLEAELAGDSAAFDAAAFARDGAAQAAVLGQRRRERDAQRASLAAEERTLRAALATQGGESATLDERLGLARELEAVRVGLVEKRAAPRLAVLEARAMRLELEQLSNRSRAEQAETAQRLGAVAAKRELFESEWRRAAGEDLQRARRERDGLVEERSKAERRASLVVLRSPVDAVVLEVADRAVGSVVEAAQPLATLLPLNAPIEAEVEIPASQMGQVRVGDEARVKLDAFPFQKHGSLDGSVRVISEDAFPPQNGNGPLFYRVRVALDGGGAAQLRQVRPNLRLLPGMTLSAEVRVGDRTVLSYFLYPVIRALDESFEEP